MPLKKIRRTPWWPVGQAIFRAPDEKDEEIVALKAKVTRQASHIEDIESDNAKLREKNRKAKADLEEVQGKLPTDGSVSVPKEDAELLAKFKEIQLKPEEIVAKIKTASDLEAKVAESERRETVRKAAEATGFKEAVLSDLAVAKGLKLELNEETVTENGETRQVPIAYVKDAQGVKTKLSEYAEKNLVDFLPALKVEAEDGGGEGTAGKPWVKSGGGPAPKTNLVDKFIEERDKKINEAPNPYAPPKVVTR
jgi:hypothetical protein